jgi:hypothetical protein
LVLGAETLAIAGTFGRTPLSEAVDARLVRRQDVELRRLLSMLIAQRVEKPLRGLEYAEMLERELA